VICDLCGEVRRALWTECAVCGIGMCGECASPEAHEAACHASEEVPCARCGEYGCVPAFCEAREAEAGGEREAAELLQAWLAGYDVPA
jgi:hypothetical protein